MLISAAEGALRRESRGYSEGGGRGEGRGEAAGKDQSLYLRQGEKRWPHPLQQLKPHLNFGRGQELGEGGVRAGSGGVGAETRDALGRTCMHWAALAGRHAFSKVLRVAYGGCVAHVSMY